MTWNDTAPCSFTTSSAINIYNFTPLTVHTTAIVPTDGSASTAVDGVIGAMVASEVHHHRHLCGHDLECGRVGRPLIHRNIALVNLNPKERPTMSDTTNPTDAIALLQGKLGEIEERQHILVAEREEFPIRRLSTAMPRPRNGSTRSGMISP